MLSQVEMMLMIRVCHGCRLSKVLMSSNVRRRGDFGCLLGYSSHMQFGIRSLDESP
jgi:hypothetical protein